MRFVEKPEVGFDNGITLTFKIPIKDRDEIAPLFDLINNYSPETDYVLNVSKAKKPRSMDANSYMWVLCDKIAQVVGTTKNEVYRDAVKEVGVWEDYITLTGEPCARLISDWGSIGIGWFAEIFPTELKGLNGARMNKVRLYKGSSRYSQQELSRLIDYIVREAKELNIETLSEQKIKEMEEAWIESQH